MVSTNIARRMGALFLLACAIAQIAGAVQADDAVQKAKAVVKQGDAQLEQARKGVREENYSEALRVLGQYRDDVKSAHAALKATGRNAEKKPGGFKNLQIHVRRSIQQLDQMILTVPREERPPFDAIRKELDLIDRELIDALFPRQPSKKSPDAAPGQ